MEKLVFTQRLLPSLATQTQPVFPENLLHAVLRLCHYHYISDAGNL